MNQKYSAEKGSENQFILYFKRYAGKNHSKFQKMFRFFQRNGSWTTFLSSGIILSFLSSTFLQKMWEKTFFLLTSGSGDNLEICKHVIYFTSCEHDIYILTGNLEFWRKLCTSSVYTELQLANEVYAVFCTSTTSQLVLMMSTANKATSSSVRISFRYLVYNMFFGIH